MPLTILSDSNVQSILHSLTQADVQQLQRNLAEALHEYSTGTQDVGGCASANQPQRAQIKTRDSTTLFMPAKTASSSGVKIVTLSSGEAKKESSLDGAASTTTAASTASAAPSAAPPAAPSLASLSSSALASAPTSAPSTASIASTAPSATTPATTPSIKFDTSSARAAVDRGTSSPRSGSPRWGSRSGSRSNSRSGSPHASSSPGVGSPRSSFASLVHRQSANSTAASEGTTGAGLLGSTAATSGSATGSGSTAAAAITATSSPFLSQSSSSQYTTTSGPQRNTTAQGTLTLLTPSGSPLALINASEVTAFRTALAATLLLTKRTRCHSIAVFGAGKQAYWHIRLALLLRGSDIHHVRIINRSFAGAEPLLQQIYSSPEWAALRQSNSKLDFSVLTKDYGEYNRLLKEYVRDADGIFCCTPSTQPLFPAEHLTSSEGRRKGRYVSLIGSYQPHMLEVSPEILKQEVRHHGEKGGGHVHYHKHAERAGVVVVDGLEACLKEAGEVIQAGLKPEELVEIGEIIMVRRAAMKEVEMGRPGEPGLKRWLEGGNVIYKSVGLGLMDLCVGEDLVRLARERGVGLTVEHF